MGRNVKVLSITVLLILITLFSWNYLLPLYLKELGATDKVIGISYTLFSLSFTLAQFVGGYLSDKCGRKLMIVIPTYLMIPFYVLMGTADHWIPVVTFYIAANICSALQSPSFISMIAESSTHKGTAFGMFEGFVALGITVGPLLGAYMVYRIAIPGLILLTACMALIVAVIRTVLLKETKPVRDRPNVDTRVMFGVNLRWFLLAATCLFLVFSFTIYGPFLTLYQREVFNLTKSKINLYFAIGGLLSAMVSLAGGKATDRFGAKSILATSVVTHPLLILLWVFTGNFTFFILSFTFSQFCYISYFAMLSSLVGDRVRGRLIGLFGTITGIVSSVGPYVGMYAKLHVDIKAPFYLAMLLGVLALMVLRNVRNSSN